MRIVSLFVIGCSLLVISCGGSTTSPTEAVRQNETFSGVLSPQSLSFHTFRVTFPGPVDITLTKAGPPVDIVIGLGVGTPTTTGTCPLIAGITAAAGPTAQLTGSATAGGDLCVAVFDSGNLTADIEYALTVLHP